MAVEDLAVARPAALIFFADAAVGGELVAEVDGVFLLAVVESLHQQVAHTVVPVVAADGQQGVALLVEHDGERTGAVFVKEVETVSDSDGIIVSVLKLFAFHLGLLMLCLLHASHGSSEVVLLEVGGYGQPDGVGQVVAHPARVGGRECIACGAGDLDAARGTVAQRHVDPASAHRVPVFIAGGIPSWQRSHRAVDGFLPAVIIVSLFNVNIR